MVYGLLRRIIHGFDPAIYWDSERTGGDFWLNIRTLNQLSYSIAQIPLILIHHADPLFLFIGLASAVVWKRLRSRGWELVDFYFAAVAVTTIVTCGRTGAHTQYVIEFCAVACSCCSPHPVPGQCPSATAWLRSSS